MIDIERHDSVTLLRIRAREVNAMTSALLGELDRALVEVASVNNA